MDPAKYSAKPRRNANAHRSVRHDFPPSPIAIRAASERARHPPQNRRSVFARALRVGSEQPLVYCSLLATPPGSRHFRAFFTAARTVELLPSGGRLTGILGDQSP